MTEEQWAVSADPAKALEWLHKRASTRKARLYAVACFAHTWDLWRNSSDWKTIPTLERLADGRAIKADRKTPEASLIAPVDWLEDLLSTECILHIPDSILDSDFTCFEAYRCVNQIVAEAENAPTSYEGCGVDLRRELSKLLRCILGRVCEAIGTEEYGAIFTMRDSAKWHAVVQIKKPAVTVAIHRESELRELVERFIKSGGSRVAIRSTNDSTDDWTNVSQPPISSPVFLPLPDYLLACPAKSRA